MKKVSVTLFAGLLAVAALLSLPAERAHALPEFNKEFQLKYIGDKSTDTQKKLAAAVETVKCDVCHGKNDMGKADKKVRNTYGQALHKFLGKKDKKDVAKIKKALSDVEAMKGENGKTFGELLNSGELPK